MDDVDTLLGDIMNKIGTITTEDPSEIVKAFSELTGCDTKLSTFFLEANRWNLQSAIISYFDTGGQTHQEAQEVPCMSLVADISGDATENNAVRVPTNSEFTKTWRFMNSGKSVWPPTFLIQSQTLNQNTVELLNALVPVPQIGPGEMCDVTAVLTAPPHQGEYVGVLRLVTAGASFFFGDEIWVLVTACENPSEGMQQNIGVDMSGLSFDTGMDTS